MVTIILFCNCTTFAALPTLVPSKFTEREAKMKTQEIGLHYNRPVRIAGTVTLECVAGCVWLTRTGGAGDVFLHPGDRYALEWPDMVLVEALQEKAGGARLALHTSPSALWHLRRAMRFLLSCLHECMRALRRCRRRNPLAG